MGIMNRTLNGRGIVRSHDCYHVFVEDTRKDYEHYVSKIRHYSYLLDKIKFQIESKRDWIESNWNIILYDYKQWNTDCIDINKRFLKIVAAKNVACKNFESSALYNLFVKYFKVLDKIQESKELLEIIKVRKNLSYIEYKAIVQRYYEGVIQEVLRGSLYKFGHGIGMFYLERFKSAPREKRRINPDGVIDWVATRKAKEELIANGKIPYRREDELACKRLGKPYNGVKYLVLRNDEYVTRMYWSNTALGNFRDILPEQIKKHETNFEEYKKRYNSVDEVITDSSITFGKRLGIIRELYKSYTINYIRNEEEQPAALYLHYSRVR
jgi:hypothetical protein